MIDREKVIKALELCTSKIETRTQIPCETCSYHNKKYHGVLGDGCCNARSLQRDALALLKAQEPRVMTLEYFDNSPDKDSKGCLVAWVEYRRDEEWAEYWEGTCDEWSVIRRDDFYSGESYRFWTSRPTDEQRKATPW